MPEQTVEDLAGRDGAVVARYLRSVRSGRPCASRIEDLAPRAAVVAALLDGRPGWAVVGDEQLGEALVKAGATLVRHAHQMIRDLRADPPDPGWAALRPPDGMRLSELRPGRRAPLDDLHELAALAYPPGHPDHRADQDKIELDGFTHALLRDRTSPLCPSSALIRDGTRLAAALLVSEGAPGPWIGNVMRAPGPRYAGLGALLLRHGMAVAAGHGDRTIGLAVSHTNPARRLYERLGFVNVATFVTVVLPDRQ